MIRYLTTGEVTILHRVALDLHGGGEGLRDPGMLDSALANPRQAFGGEELYPSLSDKAAILAFSLIKNHPFIDGNKRVAFAGLARFLRLNGWVLIVETGPGSAFFLELAARGQTRETLLAWIALRSHRLPGAVGS